MAEVATELPWRCVNCGNDRVVARERTSTDQSGRYAKGECRTCGPTWLVRAATWRDATAHRKQKPEKQHADQAELWFG